MQLEMYSLISIQLDLDNQMLAKYAKQQVKKKNIPLLPIIYYMSFEKQFAFDLANDQ